MPFFRRTNMRPPVFPEQIVPWGRTFREYELMFSLNAADLAGGVLDCGGGPSGFTAEMSARGHRAVSVDPLYSHPGSEIRDRFDTIAGSMIEVVRASPDTWNWSFHRDPEGLLANRRAALESFLADYEQGLRDRRYIVGQLPSLPFDSGSFGLALCSHLLFLYSDQLTEDFHVHSVRELCRVAPEVRIFPLLTLEKKISPHLAAVRSALESDGFTTQIVTVNYEFQPGGNQMLRIFRK